MLACRHADAQAQTTTARPRTPDRRDFRGQRRGAARPRSSGSRSSTAAGTRAAARSQSCCSCATWPGSGCVEAAGAPPPGIPSRTSRALPRTRRAARVQPRARSRPALLRAAILRHGCLLVRGLVPRADAQSPAPTRSNGRSTSASATTPDSASTPRYYEPFAPDPRLGVEARPRTGSRTAAACSPSTRRCSASRCSSCSRTAACRRSSRAISASRR